MQLYNYRNKIVRLLENKDIRPSMYAHNAISKPKKYDGVETSEQKFDESIGERARLRIQKADDKKDETDDEQLDATDMPELEIEESTAQGKTQRGQGLKILTPKQMLIRLPISLAQLKAGNNYKKHKNEIRQLLYSLYRSKKLSKTIYKHLINTIV